MVIDGSVVGESASVTQSRGAVFTVDVPAGSHDVQIVNLTYYEGQLEEHTIENNYSIDCIYDEVGHSFSKPSKFYAVYDLDSGSYYGWKKAPKVN